MCARRSGLRWRRAKWCSATGSLERRCAASEPDRLEMEAESFHARVEDGYHQLIARDPERFAVVNAEGGRDEIAAEVSEKVLAKLAEMEH